MTPCKSHHTNGCVVESNAFRNFIELVQAFLKSQVAGWTLKTGFAKCHIPIAGWTIKTSLAWPNVTIPWLADAHWFTPIWVRPKTFGGWRCILCSLASPAWWQQRMTCVNTSDFQPATVNASRHVDIIRNKPRSRIKFGPDAPWVLNYI